MTATMTVRGFTAQGQPFRTEAPFRAVRPGDTVILAAMYHQVVVVEADGTVHVGRGYEEPPVSRAGEADVTTGPDRALPPDAVVIRRTRHGWSAFSGDGLTGMFGEDGLIASSDHVGELAEYILTLEPSEIIIETGQGS